MGSAKRVMLNPITLEIVQLHLIYITIKLSKDSPLVCLSSLIGFANFRLPINIAVLHMENSISSLLSSILSQSYWIFVSLIVAFSKRLIFRKKIGIKIARGLSLYLTLKWEFLLIRFALINRKNYGGKVAKTPSLTILNMGTNQYRRTDLIKSLSTLF